MQETFQLYTVFSDKIQHVELMTFFYTCQPIFVLSDWYPYNGLFSRTAWVSPRQKGQTSLDFINEARDDGMAVASAGPSQIICTSLKTDHHGSTSSLNFYCRPDAPPDAQQTVSKHWRLSNWM